ncbi:MAG: hypothetical protein ACRDSJ_12830, partial [Rubrobacteraceae bacterium]
MAGPEESARTHARTARVCLLIPTHALPPLSYRIPEKLVSEVRIGAVVTVPLSGRSRPGVVLSVRGTDERATESLGSVSADISLPEDIVRLCE